MDSLKSKDGPRYPRIFRTPIVGIGPWCIEFEDGEIITTRHEDRAISIAKALSSER